MPKLREIDINYDQIRVPFFLFSLMLAALIWWCYYFDP